LVALPGDLVEVRDDALIVNGKRLDAPRSPRDDDGRAIPRIEAGRIAVSADRVWLWTPYRKGWDSRYFGAIPLRNVRYTANPLFHLDVPPALASLIGG
jgi:type IV secretory pathway protease TraF